jgi:hypothetical protein
MVRTFKALHLGVCTSLFFPFALALIFTIIGCGNEDTPYEGDPAEVWMHGAKYCSPNEKTGKYEEGPLVFDEHPELGTTGKHDYFAAEGGGCIARPLKEVLSATHQRTSFEWDDSHIDGEPKNDLDPRVNFFFSVEYGAFTVSWTMHWFQSIAEGTLATPKKVVINYRKVAGTTHIVYWHGNIVLYALGPRMTGFDMRQHVKAPWPTTLAKVKGGLVKRLEGYRTAPAEWKYLTP